MGRLSKANPPLTSLSDQTNQSLTNINDILTDESLLLEILQRLPYHSVVRAKSVCKRWFSLISDPYFHRTFTHFHGSHCRISHHTLIYQFSYSHRVLTETLHFKLHAVSHHPVFKYQDFLPWNSQSIMAVASHKDLLVLCDPKMSLQRGAYYICNPLTEQWLTLPPALGSHRVADTAIGFIASEKLAPSRLSYKLVRVPKLRSSLNSSQVEVEVFCSEMGEWRKFMAVCSRRVKRTWQFKPNGIAFKNKLHWVVNGESIVVFDPFEGDRESFRVIDLPFGLNSEMRICLGTCGEHLKVSQIRGCLNRMLIVWKLRDYANGDWQLEYKIGFKEMEFVDHRFLCDFKYLTAEVLAFHPSDVDILYLRRDNQIVMCDVGRRTMEVVSEFLEDSSFSIGTRGVFLLRHPCWPSTIPPLSSTY